MVAVSCNGYAVKLKFCIQIITWQLQPVSMISPTFSCRRDPQEGNILSRRWFEMGTQTINICLLREHVKWTIGTLPIDNELFTSKKTWAKPKQHHGSCSWVDRWISCEYHPFLRWKHVDPDAPVGCATADVQHPALRARQQWQELLSGGGWGW